METRRSIGTAESMELGLSELSETLRALAMSPNDPPIAPGGLVRLMRLMNTLAEPDEVAGAA